MSRALAARARRETGWMGGLQLAAGHRNDSRATARRRLGASFGSSKLGRRVCPNCRAGVMDVTSQSPTAPAGPRFRRGAGLAHGPARGLDLVGPRSGNQRQAREPSGGGLGRVGPEGWIQAQNRSEGQPPVVRVEELLDPCQGESSRLQAPDGSDPVEMGGVVEADPAREARSGEEPEGLVRPKVSRGDTSNPSELVDWPTRGRRHSFMLHGMMTPSGEDSWGNRLGS